MNVFDYIVIAAGILGVIIGLIQLSTKKCIGIMNIEAYTLESTRKFASVSGFIYLFGGIMTASAPFTANYLNVYNYSIQLPQNFSSWVLMVVIATILIAQFAILKKKSI